MGLFVGLFVCLPGLLLGNGKAHKDQTRWVGGDWSNLDFVSIFWPVVIIGVRCTSFFDFFERTSSHMAQTRCMGRAWSNLDFWSTFLGELFHESQVIAKTR